MSLRRSGSGALAAITAVSLWGGAQALARPGKAVEEVLRVEREWARALTARDLDALRRIYADDLVYVHSGGNAETKPEFLARVESGGLRYQKVELVEPKVRVYGDAAVVNGTFDVDVQVDGRPVSTRVVYVHVYARQDGRWRLVAHQTTRAPERPAAPAR